jgi:hypothetical protein
MVELVVGGGGGGLVLVAGGMIGLVLVEEGGREIAPLAPGGEIEPDRGCQQMSRAETYIESYSTM